MRFRSCLPISLMISGFLLAACDSSKSSPTADNGDPSGSKSKANGTLNLSGKNIPVLVTGLFDDTSMSLIANTDIESDLDTGWSFWLVTKPKAGTFPLDPNEPTLLGNTVTHSASGTDGDCLYQISSGSVRLDSWGPVQAGTYPTSKMSGSVTVAFSPSTANPSCPGGNASITFTDAVAASLGN